MAVDLGHGKIIPFPSATYHVKKLLGKGTFGVVTECQRLKTNETVALKIIKSQENIRDALWEAASLRMLSSLDAESFNIVRMNDAFFYLGNFFLEFEKLDVDLHTFMEMHATRSLGLKLIRPILQQVATALNFLSRAGVTHADLKPQNIMLVDHVKEPLRVKVIDFGLSMEKPQNYTGAVVQSMWYRAPEVLLGAPFGAAIDVWSLGCIAAQMLMGKPLFYTTCEQELMRQIVRTIEMPSQELLDAGRYTDKFFWPKHRGTDTRELKLAPGVVHTLPHRSPNLYEIIMWYHQYLGKRGYVEENDVANFISLVMEMLRVDPSNRISPGQILEHPFLTLSHLLVAFSDHPYVVSSYNAMSPCRLQSEAKGADGGPSSNHPPADRMVSHSSTTSYRKRKCDDRRDMSHPKDMTKTTRSHEMERKRPKTI